MTEEEMIRWFEDQHKEDQRKRDEAHRSVMEGFVKPIIREGLVDELTKKEDNDATP